MSGHAPAISVVTPMHDEEECVGEFVRRTDAALRAIGRPYEIVVVSDGSTDRTEEIVRGLCAGHPALRGVFLARNTGQCTALHAGIQQSRGDVVVVMDGGGIIEAGAPATIFTNPTQERTRAFLQAVLTRA